MKHPTAFPFAAMPVAACVAEHVVGVAASALAVAALPVVEFAMVPVWATIWPLLLVPTIVADAGTAAPFTLTTVGFGYVPERSPPAVPEGGKLVGVPLTWL